MRSTTAAQDTALAANVRGEFVQIEVQNADGTWIDLTNLVGFDWVVRWSVRWGVDQPLPEARVSLVRDRSDANRSLAPLRSDSPLNVDDLAAYAPLLDGGRGLRINVAVMAWGQAPTSGDWVRLFTGEIDEVEWGQDPVEVIARSAIGVQLADRFIETETVYGSDAGTAMETVIQSILTDWTDDPLSLYTPTSPGFNVTSTPFQGISVLDALNRIVALIGWAVRERWHDGTSQFRLTLQDPDRSKTIQDHTFGPGDYWDVESLRIGRNEIRNAIRVTYVDSATGETAFVTAEDATSIARYGRKPLLITESSTGPIDTEAEAQAMADAALADLKDPVAEQRVDNRFFWPAQLGDLYTWSANGVHYNVDQDLAVTGIEHHGETGMCGTTLDVRGAPMGFNRYWWKRDSEEAAPRLAASFEPRVVPAVVGGVAGAHIDIAYDLASDVTRVHFQFSYTDGTTATISRNVDLTGSGVYRLQESGGSSQLFLPSWTDIEILCRVNNNSFDPSQLGRQYIFSYPDIFAGGEGVRAALSAGGTAQADYFVPGSNVTIDIDANGRPRVNATGGGTSALDDLSDVTITAPATGDALFYDTGQWVNRDIDASDIRTGTLGVVRGGTGRPEVTSGRLLIGATASPMQELDFGAAGGFVRSNGSAWVRSEISAGDVTSGTFADARIPNLATSKITSGIFDLARIPSIPVSKLTPGLLASTSWTWNGGDGSASLPALAFGNQANTGIYRVGTSIIGGATAGTLRFQIDTAGVKVVSGSAAAPSMAGLSFTTSGIYWASGVLGLSVNGTSRIRATTSGAAVTGTITATGDVQSSVSDERLKTEIVPIEGALARVGRLRGVYHRYTDEAIERWPELKAGRRAALIAQDVAEVLPEASIPFAGDPEYLNYLPDMVIPLLVEAIHELQAEVEQLRARRVA